MPDLKGKRVAILIGPQFHDEEATSPKNHLQQLGANVDLIGLDRSPLTGKMGRVLLTPDRGIDEIAAGEYDGIIIPGGGAPERIRVNDQAIALVRAFWASMTVSSSPAAAPRNAFASTIRPSPLCAPSGRAAGRSAPSVTVRRCSFQRMSWRA